MFSNLVSGRVFNPNISFIILSFIINTSFLSRNSFLCGNISIIFWSLSFVQYPRLSKSAVIWGSYYRTISFPGGSVVKNPPADDEGARDVGSRDVGSIPGSWRSLGVGNGNPLQHSWLENSTDREAWRATVHGSQRVRHNWMINTLSFTH